MRARIPLLLLLAVALVPTATVGTSAQARAGLSLDEARGLYASAEYERALVVLDRLVADPAVDEGRPAASFYRALCLLALGRSEEATSAVEALVAEHPSYRPAQELPPRVQALFEGARARFLPMAIQARYLAARAAYDQRDFGSALQARCRGSPRRSSSSASRRWLGWRATRRWRTCGSWPTASWS